MQFIAICIYPRNGLSWAYIVVASWVIHYFNDNLTLVLQYFNNIYRYIIVEVSLKYRLRYLQIVDCRCWYKKLNK